MISYSAKLMTHKARCTKLLFIDYTIKKKHRLQKEILIATGTCQQNVATEKYLYFTIIFFYKVPKECWRISMQRPTLMIINRNFKVVCGVVEES